MKKCLDCGKIKSNKGLYCKKCGYKHRIRPRGLKYILVKKNPTSFKKGMTPWNKGTKGLIKVNSGSIKKGERRGIKTEFTSEKTFGKNNYNWRGDEVGYYSLHLWIYRNYGKPDKCENCKSIKNVQWASKNYKYTRNREDWIKLCFKCHRKYDVKNGWGKASYQFPEIKKIKICASQ